MRRSRLGHSGRSRAWRGSEARKKAAFASRLKCLRENAGALFRGRMHDGHDGDDNDCLSQGNAQNPFYDVMLYLGDSHI